MRRRAASVTAALLISVAGDAAAALALEQTPPADPRSTRAPAQIKAGIAAASAWKAKKPWTLDQRNWELGKDLLPEVILSRVKKGEYSFRVVDADPEELKRGYSTRFWEASAANAGKYDLDAATCGLKNVATGKIPDFYFGYPFPHIDPSDPQAACKVAWNVEAATAMGEGLESAYTLSGVDGAGEFKRIKFSRWDLYYQGRHGGPIENPEGLRSVVLVNLLEPQDIDGVASLSKRINDWTPYDKIWFFVPSTRRVRRVQPATRSDPLAGLDAYYDDVDCNGAKVEYFRWTLLGETNVVAPFIAPQLLRSVSQTRFEVTIPQLRAGYERPGQRGAPWWVGDDDLLFTPRPVWVVEGKSNDPYYNFAKVIMYVDKDLYRIYWRLVHDRSGQYFYNALCAYCASRTADGTFGAVTQILTVGVNDRTNRAALVRATSSFVERHVEEAPYRFHRGPPLSD